MTVGARDDGLKFKLTQYKMAEFKDGIPIIYQLFLNNFS